VLLDEKAYDEALTQLEAKHGAPFAAQFAALEGTSWSPRRSPRRRRLRIVSRWKRRTRATRRFRTVSSFGWTRSEADDAARSRRARLVVLASVLPSMPSVNPLDGLRRPAVRSRRSFHRSQSAKRERCCGQRASAPPTRISSVPCSPTTASSPLPGTARSPGWTRRRPGALARFGRHEAVGRCRSRREPRRRRDGGGRSHRARSEGRQGRVEGSRIQRSARGAGSRR
jgi:hypothetical protein